jgi:hypothetical protein
MGDGAVAGAAVRVRLDNGLSLGETSNANAQEAAENQAQENSEDGKNRGRHGEDEW